jgi:hypothetical protein
LSTPVLPSKRKALASNIKILPVKEMSCSVFKIGFSEKILNSRRSKIEKDKGNTRVTGICSNHYNFPLGIVDNIHD